MQDEKVERLKKELELTKKLAVEAFHKVEARGGALESLVPKTEGLKSESARFKRSARDLNNNGCCSCFASFWSSVTDYVEDSYLSLTNDDSKKYGYGATAHSVTK